MKNRFIERCRKLARQYHRSNRNHQFEQGILVYHDYSETHPEGLSWWDDVQFILGRVRIEVTWNHPRQIYQDMVEEAATRAVDHLYVKAEGDLFDDATKNYKKAGRSRKKIVSYTLEKRLVPEEWADALDAERARLNEEADFSATPSLKTKQLSWCRFVEVVAPIEVRSIQELRRLVDLVRRILKGEATLAHEFPDYVYGKAQWTTERSYGDHIHQ